MSLLSVSNVTHGFGGQDVFNNISINIEKDSKIGLIGKNGSGKTTLFRIISGKLKPDRGDVHISKGRKIAYLTQDAEFAESGTLFDIVLDSKKDIINLSKSLKKAEEEISRNPSDENYNKLNKLQERFELLGGYNFENEVESVLTHLNFPRETWQQNIAGFSGGEKTRIQLARILLQDFDLILLDEPTNHLDFEMIFWLEKYLRNSSKPYIIVSHDRRFLDKTITKTVEIRDKGLCFYSGNYTFYKDAKKINDERQLKEYKQQQKHIKVTEDFIRKNMAGQKVKQAKSRLKMLDKLDVIEKPQEDSAVKLNIETDSRTGNDVFRIRNGEFGFPDKKLATNIEVNVHYKDKVAILGKNGCGKSTFLKILANEMELKSGELYRGSRLKIGYYDQMHINLDDTKSVMEIGWALMPAEPQGKVISYLAKFGFYEDDLDKKVSVLSGGEKARLYLAKLMFSKPNLLLLDEPTNHLDLNTVANLESALMNYDGTIVLVSHDLYFVKAIADKYWHFNGMTINETDLSPEEIYNKELERNKDKKEKKIVSKKKIKKTNPIILDKKLEEISKKEDELKIAETELEKVQVEFSSPETFINSARVKELHKKLQKLEEMISQLKEEIDNLEIEYLELSS